MNINITEKDFELTDAIKSYITEKVSKLQKNLGDDFDAVATLKIEGNQQVAEIRVTAAGAMYKAVAASKDLYASIDKDIDILEGQIRKQKTKNDKQNMTESELRAKTKFKMLKKKVKLSKLSSTVSNH